MEKKQVTARDDEKFKQKRPQRLSINEPQEKTEIAKCIELYNTLQTGAGATNNTRQRV